MKRFKAIFLTSLALMAVANVPAYAGTSASTGFDPSWALPTAVVAGMVVNASTIAGLYKSFNTIFNEAMSAAQPQYPKIAMTVPSSTRSNGYVWLGAWPKMREWIGDRELRKLKAYDYEIKNKTWESTVEIPAEEIEDDTYGVYNPVVSAMGVSVKLHPDELEFALLAGGFTKKGYDGKTFFATDHDSGSNKLTDVFAAAGFEKAVQKLLEVKDDKERPLFAGTEKLTLTVGPALNGAARRLLNNEFLSVASGSTENNIWKGAADLVVSPLITSATAWFLTCDFAGLKPLIFQERRKPRFIQKDNPVESDVVFMRNKFIFGADARYEAGYGLHQLAIGSTGAG